MPPAVTQATIAKLYKTIYPPGTDLTNLSKRKTPFGDQIKKTDTLYGANLTFPVNGGMGWGVAGGTLSATSPAAASKNFENWTFDTNTKTSYLYGRVTHDTPSIMRASKDVGAFMRLGQETIQETLDNMKMFRCGIQPWSDGSGMLAQVISVTGANPITTITISAADSVKFDGFSGQQKIEACSTASGIPGTLKTSQYYVTGVNRLDSSGNCVLTVTRDGAGGGPGQDPAATEFLFNVGSRANGPDGVRSWIPLTDPTSTPFNGINRTKEMQLLSGWRGQWEGSISRSASKLSHYMTSYVDPNTSALWLHPYRWWQLAEEQKGEKTFEIDNARTLEWGTSVLRMVTPAGIIPVASDEYCPADAGYLLNHDSWEMHTTGPLIHAADEDVTGLRLSDSDALEYRFRSLALLRCKSPIKNGVFPISQTL